MKITKHWKTQLISFLLCLLMIAGSICELPMAVSATEINTDNEAVTAPSPDSASGNSIPSSPEIIPGDSLDIQTAEDDATGDTTDGDDTITVTFYDSDGTTVLFSIPMNRSKEGEYLTSYLDSMDKLMPVRKGYQLYRWSSPKTGNLYTPRHVYTKIDFKNNHAFNAQWNTEPYTFDIAYNLNGGNLITGEDESYPTEFTVTSEAITLPQAQQKGYLFDGWCTESTLENKVTTIPKGTYIDSDENGQVDSYNLYAKWSPVAIEKIQKPTAINNASGKIKVSFKKIADADGYQIVYGTNQKITKNKMVETLSNSKSTFTLTNLPKNKTYYFKIRAYKNDSTGVPVYGEFSSTVKCKVTKGVNEYTAKSNSGNLKKVSVKGTDLYVTATVSKRLKSSDEFYYLVKVDPNTGKVLKQIAKTYKEKNLVFQLPLKDEKGNNHIQGKFGVAVKNGKKYTLISSTSFIDNPQAAATYTAAFPTPASKKGRQGLYNSELGDKNYFKNFNLNEIIGNKSNYDVTYKYNGKTYYFKNPNFGNIGSVNSDGGTVTIQVMLQWSENANDLILKSGRTPGAHYYAFNTEQKAAREKLEAAFCFLAEQGSTEYSHVDNWILGNEVNTYANPTAKWYYAGDISRNKFMDNYASTYRMLYYAVKSNNKNGRVYICTDHTWTDREKDWGTKDFLTAFNREIKSQNKNIKWNLAYHAYSAVLTNADFWNDGKLAPKNENADFVSPNNLEILTDYVKKKFGKDVRIILSEQGFSYSGGTGSPYNRGRQTGESVQAAAMAWLYYKAQFSDMIDAVIFSSGDHGGAGYQFDIAGKKAENVYKYMDTPKYATYTKDCLKTIGKSSWSKVVNGFSAKKLKKMPNR